MVLYPPHPCHLVSTHIDIALSLHPDPSFVSRSEKERLEYKQLESPWKGIFGQCLHARHHFFFDDDRNEGFFYHPESNGSDHEHSDSDNDSSEGSDSDDSSSSESSDPGNTPQTTQVFLILKFLN
jgi:hypothetical protein